MKRFAIIIFCCCASYSAIAQDYPEPEFTNEIYYLKNNNPPMVTRLEKGFSKMDTKIKLGGFGGGESGYVMDAERSTIRLNDGKSISFIYSTGASSQTTSAQDDSTMRAHGIDPGMVSGYAGAFDPTSMISLYKADVVKGKRKIYLQKNNGVFSGKIKTTDKYSFSTKQIRPGYWELVIDKPLPKGEYIFTCMAGGQSGMGDAIQLFAFAID